jgi:hypothetical protein
LNLVLHKWWFQAGWMWIKWTALISAGLVAGVSGTVTGVGSVFSYPALLALGLPATAANVTNTVSLALGGFGGVYGSRPELVGQAATARWLCLACAAGSTAGSALVLLSPPAVFADVVPFLVAGASASILLPRPRSDGSDTAGQHPGRSTVLGMLAVSIYNGYFAAAGGVLIIAVLLITTTQTLARINALKNVLVVISDVIAALVFATFGPVSWGDVPPLAIGLLLGSWLGPAIARRLPADKLRVGIAVAGLGLAVKLGLDAF